jgi:hypothetical protein
MWTIQDWDGVWDQDVARGIIEWDSYGPERKSVSIDESFGL